MVTTILTCMFLGKVGGTAPPPTAAGLIGKMMSLYATDQSLSGEIKMTQVAQGQSVQADTMIAYRRPDLMHIEQTESNLPNKVASLISDGVHFAYTPPRDLQPAPPKFVEAVHPTAKVSIGLNQMYAIASESLFDRSLPLDVAVGRPLNLKMRADQLASFTLKGLTTINDRSVYEIDGQWRESVEKPPSGTFSLYIDPDGNLVRYVISQVFAVPASWLAQHHLPLTEGQGITVVTTWDVNLRVNADVPNTAFSLGK